MSYNFRKINPYLGDFGNISERHFWTKNPELLFHGKGLRIHNLLRPTIGYDYFGQMLASGKNCNQEFITLKISN